VTDPKWCQALQTMNTELAALERNGTWEITSLPPSKRAIRCKWLFKAKFKSDGIVKRKKARLVTQGCRQSKGINYEETFAPIAKTTIVRTVLAVATQKHCYTC